MQDLPLDAGHFSGWPLLQLKVTGLEMTVVQAVMGSVQMQQTSYCRKPGLGMALA